MTLSLGRLIRKIEQKKSSFFFLAEIAGFVTSKLVENAVPQTNPYAAPLVPGQYQQCVKKCKISKVTKKKSCISKCKAPQA